MTDPITYNEWTRILSRFQSTMRKLLTNGDYPEYEEDVRILSKMIDHQFDRMGVEANPDAPQIRTDCTRETCPLEY